MADCVLKIKNSTIAKLNIDATNSSKLLDAESSEILEATFSMDFDSNGNGQSVLTQNVITLDKSSLKASLIDIESIISLTPYLIHADTGSKSFIYKIIGDGSATSSPDWTKRTDTSITYGNSMSYSIYSGAFADSMLILSDYAVCVTDHNILIPENINISDDVVCNMV